MRPSSLGTRKSPLEMYLDHLIKLGVRHVLESITRDQPFVGTGPSRVGNVPLVPQDSRIVHEDGDSAKGIDGALDDSRTVRHGRCVHDGVSAS